MSDTATIESPTVTAGRVYTPAQIAEFAQCSSSYVRKEIGNGNLPAFRLGGKLLRIKGEDAWTWLTGRSGNTGLASSRGDRETSLTDNGAPYGEGRRTGVDTALASVRSERRV